jgi:hypothetical protein
VSADEWERFEPECGTILASFELIEEQGRRFVPTDRYQKKFIEGWTIYVNEDLLADGTELGNQVLRLLKAKLYEAERVLPAKACEELRGVPIWLEVDDGGASGAGYVSSSREALRANGYNPDKAKSIQIRNASRFLRWTLDQPALLLHELAHAYHDRVLGQDHESIAAAFRAKRGATRRSCSSTAARTALTLSRTTPSILRRGRKPSSVPTTLTPSCEPSSYVTIRSCSRYCRRSGVSGMWRNDGFDGE